MSLLGSLWLTIPENLGNLSGKFKQSSEVLWENFGKVSGCSKRSEHESSPRFESVILFWIRKAIAVAINGLNVSVVLGFKPQFFAQG